ncbi:hypothetical protein AB0L75_18205 [Streptomyces sp. NPDC052101]|uniref:hypothetical protein n=1 Tax=Streptomyces sp. NPDC052101 TaxID=3155763 RepID=UPI003423FBE2
MTKRLKNRVLTLFAACAVLGGTSVTLGASQASAADWTFAKKAVSSNGSFSIAAYHGGTYVGVMEWNADPIDATGTPGDAFRVGDIASDGWGMEAYMIVPTSSRTATTRGHAAVYYSPWNTGNLAEGSEVAIQLCAVNGDVSACSIAYTGHA